MTDTHLPHSENPLLKRSYSLLAPLYDLVAESGPLRAARVRSLQSLPTDVCAEVLLSGIGTGLDLPLLPTLHHYTALDFSAAMLSRAKLRGDTLHEAKSCGAKIHFECLQVDWVLGDSMALPFPDAQFDHVVLHLIVAVVPQPSKCLSEAARVLKPGGTIILFDKFLKPKKIALLRRTLNLLSRRFVTRMDVVFEEVLHEVPSLQVVSDVPLLAGGWFRGIVLRKG
jgi:phosphatidylethanolamine/phosphatidyl-N-methylethanolamine N-methyltransferase